MNTLNEQLNKQELERVSEISGVKGLPLSKVLMNNKSHENRRSAINKFFGDRKFSYSKFANIIRPETPTFKLEDRKFIKKFAKKEDTKTKSGDVEIWYDEYIETFFIYIYYQLFVKLFAMSDIVVANNKENIENAKKILSGIKDKGLVEDVKENIVNVYKAFYSFMIPVGSPSKIESSSDAQIKYFEDFVNKNVSMFYEYPLSTQLTNFSTDNVSDLMDSIFDASKRIDVDNRSNRQLIALKVLSNMVEAGKPSFDFVELQELMERYPTVTDSKTKIKFPDSVRGNVEDALEVLSSFNELERIGMGWASGTQWEPFIGIMCGIISLREISDEIKKIAKQTQEKKSEYVQLLDTDEKDKGVFFINNEAFVSATSEIPELKDLVTGLDRIINSVFEKTNHFQKLDPKDLSEELFVTYNPKYAASDISSLSSEDKYVLEKVMRITQIITNYGANLDEGLANINQILFNLNHVQKTGLPEHLIDAEEFAKKNSGDLLIRDTDDFLSAFSPSSVIRSITSVSSATVAAFSKIFSSDFSIDNVISSFNEAFSAEFGFAKMDVASDGTTVNIRINNKIAIQLKTKEEIKEYVMFMCSSMASIMYHSKVMFGEGGDFNSRYKTYFNVLSWFLKTAKDAGKMQAFETKEYPLSYKVTPFAVDFVKYALRAFVNNIHEIVDSSVKDEIRDSHKKKEMDASEWKPLSNTLTDEVKSYLEKALKLENN